ncbi:MAG: cadmium-translocating P-type ATPase [Candidatus Cloacimonetes bacterium]|nr:cadmium-translocating P-type ATPase [Candidatus Cloacimonadota bacterium]MCB5254575.1 cadmium-translocating P-type ATPase [Candidatus Cloacimonadota bacterium]MCK9178759.1 cadmium-translocating P-type ATPase [Candidatus Cloacimonadota bacterium]MCK9242475.1 cadmium-translocating P-type ATPase [Candidatus Cloacimonadota bacterium]
MNHKKNGSDTEHPGDHHDHMLNDFKKKFIVSLILTIPILILSPMFLSLLGIPVIVKSPLAPFLLFGLSSIVYWYGGLPFLKGMIRELKEKQPGMMTLIAVAISTAYFYSTAVLFGLSGTDFFWELVTLIDIMLLGHWIEMKSVMGASKALDALAQLLPSDAHRIMPDGSIEDVPVHLLNKGDKIVIKPGEKIPADGDIIEGLSAVNEAMLTGESKPVTKKKGDEVIGGSINEEGSLTVEVKGTGEDSFLARVIEHVRKAQKSKSKTQDLANRAASWLTYVTLGSGAISLLVWFFIVNQDLAFSLERAVTVMVISCPHALGLAIPLVVAATTSIAAAHGLLIRNRNSFEQARSLSTVIFDKTGTLTEGRFGVTDTLPFDQEYEGSMLKYAASVEAYSEHPIARAIAESVDDLWEVEDFQAITGKGAMGKVKGKEIKIMGPGYLREQNIETEDARISDLQSQGKTVVFVFIDDVLAGAIALADIVKEESSHAIQALKALGIRSIMLTGDNERVAAWVSEKIGIDEYFADVLPEDKSNKIKEVQARGMRVAMIGDGVNDAPALAQADLGIAIGAGSGVAIETADVILVKSNPLDVVSVIHLSKATHRKMVQNLLWATGYNVIAIPLAAGVLYSFGILLSPAYGAVLMTISTVIVAINARLLRIKSKDLSE